jgi:hypothetical protein
MLDCWSISPFSHYTASFGFGLEPEECQDPEIKQGIKDFSKEGPGPAPPP